MVRVHRNMSGKRCCVCVYQIYCIFWLNKAQVSETAWYGVLENGSFCTGTNVDCINTNLDTKTPTVIETFSRFSRKKKTNNWGKTLIDKTLVCILQQEGQTHCYIQGWCHVCLMNQVNRSLAYPLSMKHVFSCNGERVAIVMGNLVSRGKLYAIHRLQLSHKRHSSNRWIMPAIESLYE